MNYPEPVIQTARALAFLTRLPIPDRFFEDAGDHGSSECAGYYPAAGLIIGLIGAISLLAAGVLQIDPMVSAAVAILAITALTGALHEDGLGDTADGFGGGANKERRLEIMRDSRLGTYGAIAVCASLLLRVLALGAIIKADGLLAGIFALVAVHMASRGAMVWMWGALPSAKTDGVAASVGKPPESAVSLAAILGLGALLFFGIFGLGLVSIGMAVIIALLAFFAFQRLTMRMIGGQTGDTLGACQQIVEISLLVGLSAQL